MLVQGGVFISGSRTSVSQRARVILSRTGRDFAIPGVGVIRLQRRIAEFRKGRQRIYGTGNITIRGI